ncbi:carboxypeptidase regulatory-like domain-containing protein [Corallococcus macrosporus]|uniref:Carboxypeptidase regulatory-like domain-containing protein n=1 Tax=Corallococcus macrosporus TaxID=35 RepID=A0ABS3DAN7_9BACT|nr:carboxypeptidase regulatory-like domain-containing protein [Corallococcus macrosporus]MBN8228697.1 carboxypeptidase regulatory-like domain-containing protein [Corallococcus macrosporus]
MGNARRGGLKPWLGGGALAVVALLAFLLWNARPASSATDAPSPASASTVTPKPRVSQLTTPPRPVGTARITGRVLGTHGAAVGVRVSASRVEPGLTLSERPCPSPSGPQDAQAPLLKTGRCSFDSEHMLGEAVEARDGEAPVFAEAATDAEGRFVLDGLPEGSVTLWALGDTGAVSQGGVPVGSDDVELTLEQGVLFQGRVTATDRTPIPDARVTLVSRWHTRFFDATTDAEGHFVAGPLPQGSYAAFVTADGGSSWFKPELDSPADLAAVVLARTLPIAGQVLSAEGTPAPGVQVLLEGSTATASTQRTTTDDAGCFRFTAPAVAHQLNAESGGAFATLDVTPPLEHVELRLQQGVFLEGTVRDDTGQPIPNARVQTYREDGGPLAAEADTATDSAGRYRMGPTRSGPHTFRILASHHLDLEVTAQKLLRGMAPLDFMLRRAKSVEGRVVDTSGAPLEGIHLELSGNLGAWDDLVSRDSQRSDATGRFVLDAQRGGKAQLLVEDPSFQSLSIDVSVPSKDVVVVLDRGASVSGTVTDPRGLPLRGATVTLLEDSEDTEDSSLYEEPRQGMTDEQGRFQLQGIAPGKYLLGAVIRGDLIDASVSQPIAFQAREHQDVSLRLEAGRQRSGIAVDGTGQPLADVMITAALPDEDDSQWRGGSGEDGPAGLRTGPDGRFTLRGLVAPRYALWASLPGHSFRPERSQGGEPFTEQGGLWVDSGEAPLRLVLERDGRIRGRVVGSRGEAVTSFTVHGRGLLGQEQPGEWPDGVFDLPFKGSGPATLTVRASGFAPLIRDVTLTEGVDMDLGVLTLDPGWTLRLALQDAETGAVLSDVGFLYAKLMNPADSDIARAMVRPRRLAPEDDGYTLTQLPPPPFVLELKARGTRPFQHEVTSRLDTLTVPLDLAAKVRFTAQDKDGKPLPALIRLRYAEGLVSYPFQEYAPEGTVLSRGIEPGEYFLDARPIDPESKQHFPARRIQIPPRGEVAFTVEATPP